jgi:hypothetical protein
MGDITALAIVALLLAATLGSIAVAAWLGESDK